MSDSGADCVSLNKKHLVCLEPCCAGTAPCFPIRECPLHIRLAMIPSLTAHNYLPSTKNESQTPAGISLAPRMQNNFFHQRHSGARMNGSLFLAPSIPADNALYVLAPQRQGNSGQGGCLYTYKIYATELIETLMMRFP